MKKYFLFIIIGCFVHLSFSQKSSDAHIVGHILDKTTEEHLPFINIMLEGTTIGTTTDQSGHYSLYNLPTGTFNIKVFALGYKTIVQTVDIEKDKMLELNFFLEEDAVLLNNVVVTANKNETNRAEAPTIVNVITPQLFELNSSVCLADGLNFQPGLRLESNCQNCGFQQVRINGLDGSYTQILIDSRAVSSALAGVYGLEQIPVNMIERVEVVRGGGSSLFGSNAVAGTINIITREAFINSLSISNTTSLIGCNTPDVNTNLNGSVVSKNGKAGVTLFGSSRIRNSYDADSDGYSEIGKLKSSNIGFRAYYRTGTYSKLSVEYHTLNEFRRGGDQLEKPPHEVNIAEQTEHAIQCAGLKYDMYSKNRKHRFQLYSSFQHINRQSYYGTHQDPNAYGNTIDILSVSGGQYDFSMKKFLFMPATLTTGVEFNYNSLNDKALGYNRTINQTINIYSVFVQNEWKNELLTLLIGGRLDKHNLVKAPIFSPRISIRYSPKKWIAIRGGYSAGFRAPQAFDEDLHITAVGGEVSLIVLDSNLTSEKSNSVNLSFEFNKRWSRTAMTFLVEGFYTDLNNVFVLREKGHDEMGNIIMERTNGSGAFVSGVNFEGKLIPFKQMEIQFGFTYQQSLYKQPEKWSESVEAQRKMYRSPNTYGFLSVNYTPFKRFDIAVSAVYTGSMLVQHFAGYVAEDRDEITPQFIDCYVKIMYDFKLNDNIILQLNGGIKNIFNSYQSDFDKGANRDAGYIYGPSLPRTIFFGLKFEI